MQKQRVVDLFSGAGGLSGGAVKAGFEVNLAVDDWECARNTYSENYSHQILDFDLSNISESVETIKAISPDIVVGGPPCQDFSSAGVRKEGGRADLTYSFAQIIAEVQPQYFLMENVPTARNSKAFSRAKSAWKQAGYGLTEVVVDASHFSVPQHRKRLVVIGELGGAEGNFLDPIYFEESVFSLSVRKALPDISVEHYYRHPRSYTRRGIFSTRESSPTIRGVNRPRPVNYRPHSQDSYIGSDVRSLTAMERSRIQTFPSNFKWIGTSAEIDQMIGNAMPVEMASNLLGLLGKSKRTTVDEKTSFKHWLENQQGLSRAGAIKVINYLRRAHKVISYLENDDTSADSLLNSIARIQYFSNLSAHSVENYQNSIEMQLRYENIFGRISR